MTSVVSAVKDVNIRALRILLQSRQCLNSVDVERGLLLACKLGLLECAQHLLETDVDVDCEDPSGNRPIHHAVSTGSYQLIKLLLNCGASPNVRGSSRNYPLHMAAKNDLDEVMDHLLSNKARINAKDSADQTPLIVATRSRSFPSVKLLISRGCDVNLQDGTGRTALHYASQMGTGVDILLAAGANPDVCDNNNCTPLLLAATEGFCHIVKLLCRAKCNPDIANVVVRKTPIHILSFKGHVECVEELLHAGAQLDIYDRDFRTPLWYAVDNGYKEVVKLLLKASSQVDTYQCSQQVPPEACPVALAHTRMNSSILKMFMMTGYDDTHLRDCLNGNNVSSTLQKELSPWLHSVLETMTLKQLCRRWIRHHCGASLLEDVDSLPIPPGLHDFLLLKELDDIYMY